MAMGTVKRFDASKGYGFVTPADGGKDAFFHVSDIASRKDRDELWRFEPGVRVGCNIEIGPKGPRATRVVLVSAPPDDAFVRLLAIATQSAEALVEAGVAPQQVTDTISGWRVAERLRETEILHAENGWEVERERMSYLEVWLTPVGDLHEIYATRIPYSKFGDEPGWSSHLGPTPITSIDDLKQWDGDYAAHPHGVSRSGSKGRCVTTQISKPIGRRRNPATWLAEELENAVDAAARAVAAAPAPQPISPDRLEQSAVVDNLPHAPQRSARRAGWFRRRGT